MLKKTTDRYADAVTSDLKNREDVFESLYLPTFNAELKNVIQSEDLAKRFYDFSEEALKARDKILNEFSKFAKVYGKLHESYLDLAFSACAKNSDCATS